MVDGQPRKVNQNNRTALLAERARSFYNASREDFIDNVKQFAYEPRRIEIELAVEPGAATLQDVGAVLLQCVRGLF